MSDFFGWFLASGALFANSFALWTVWGNDGLFTVSDTHTFLTVELVLVLTAAIGALATAIVKVIKSLKR